MECVCWFIRVAIGIVPLLPNTVHGVITHRYTVKIFPSIYSSGNENYSLLKALIINAFLTNRITDRMKILTC